MKGRPGCDFSFAGLKTAIRLLVEGLGPARTPRDAADIAAAFQVAAGDVLADRTANAIAEFKRRHGPQARALVVAGGVAANSGVRRALEALAAGPGLRFVAPPQALCTDNAAMIAWAGLERLAAGAAGDPLDIAARPRWPLDPAAEPVRGAGVKG
jgi:N6-L-threonylcarbamoyladenine synthase